MNRRTITILILLVALAVAIAGSYLVIGFNYLMPIPKDAEKKAAVEEEIYLCLLKVLVTREHSRSGDTMFLRIDGKAVDKGMLDRFAEKGLEFSTFEKPVPLQDNVATSNKVSDAFVFPYELGKVEWRSGRRVAVDEWRALPGDTYILEKRWGKWVVVDKDFRGNIIGD